MVVKPVGKLFSGPAVSGSDGLRVAALLDSPQARRFLIVEVSLVHLSHQAGTTKSRIERVGELGGGGHGLLVVDKSQRECWQCLAEGLHLGTRLNESGDAMKALQTLICFSRLQLETTQRMFCLPLAQDSLGLVLVVPNQAAIKRPAGAADLLHLPKGLGGFHGWNRLV